MELHVMSRADARRFSFNPGGTVAFISINDMEDKANGLKNNPLVAGVCALWFDDLTDEECLDLHNGIHQVIAEEDTKKIKRFADCYWGKVDHFVVHCYAGKSRSVGCMSALCRAYGVEDVCICRSSYSKLVATAVLKEYGLPSDFYAKA